MKPTDPLDPLHALLADLPTFARKLAEIELRPYQTEPAAAILDSVHHGKGLTFTVMMSRQAGKNELSAQLEAYLLTLHHREGGSIVKIAPTFRPQIVNSQLRLHKVLDNPLTAPRWGTSQGYITRVGKARIFFFSAAPDSQIVGATASILLEVDEAQDVDEQKYLKDARPMGASTNVTTVLWGTAWTNDTLLEHTRQENARLEAQDGIKRNFTYPWNVVGQSNPAYYKFVEAEIDRMGPLHPLVRTQYLIEALSTAGRLLNEEQLTQLRGDHPKLAAALPDETYVAGIDLAGGDEEAESEILSTSGSRRDSTSVTIARVIWKPTLRVPEPTLQVVAHRTWTNVRHRDTFEALVQLLTSWRVESTSIDASGIGAGVASFLVGAMGADRIHPLTFTAVSKSDLGYQLLTAINAGRLQLYADNHSPDSTELWSQARLARSTLHANQRLSWYVNPTDGHDDLLVSLALAVEAAQHSEPRAAVGRPARPQEPPRY